MPQGQLAQVLRDVLGYAPERVRALIAEGAVHAQRAASAADS